MVPNCAKRLNNKTTNVYNILDRHILYIFQSKNLDVMESLVKRNPEFWTKGF